MPHAGTLEICRKYLYEDIDKIPEGYRPRLIRIRSAYTYWYEFPTKSRRNVCDKITAEYKVTTRTAYEDLAVVEILLGNIKNPEKTWIRYRINAMLEEAYEIAKGKNDAKSIALIADKLGKYNNLDKEDIDALPFDQIVPQPFIPSDDPTPLGIKKDPSIREKKRKMLEKYSAEIETIDISYEELTDEKGSKTDDIFQ